MISSLILTRWTKEKARKDIVQMDADDILVDGDERAKAVEQ